MSTSVINKSPEKSTAFRYLYVSIFCIVFGIVYEMFSNGVYSIFMLGAFVFPLLGGTAVFFVLHKVKQTPPLFSRYLYHSGIATFTVGSIIEGVLEIYGTTNSLTVYYWYAGAALFAAGIVSFITDCIIKRMKHD